MSTIVALVALLVVSVTGLQLKPTSFGSKFENASGLVLGDSLSMWNATLFDEGVLDFGFVTVDKAVIFPVEFMNGNAVNKTGTLEFDFGERRNISIIFEPSSISRNLATIKTADGKLLFVGVVDHRLHLRLDADGRLGFEENPDKSIKFALSTKLMQGLTLTPFVLRWYELKFPVAVYVQKATVYKEPQPSPSCPPLPTEGPTPMPIVEVEKADIVIPVLVGVSVAVGTLILLLALFLGGFFCFRRRRVSKSGSTATTPAPTTSSTPMTTASNVKTDVTAATSEPRPTAASAEPGIRLNFPSDEPAYQNLGDLNPNLPIPPPPPPSTEPDELQTLRKHVDIAWHDTPNASQANTAVDAYSLPRKRVSHTSATNPTQIVSRELPF